MGRYLTLSSSGLHRGKSTVQSQQLPAHRSCLLSENQDDFCMPLDTGSLHLSGPQTSHTEAGNSSLSLKVPGKNPAGPGDGETEDWRGDTRTTGPSSSCRPGGFPVLGGGWRDHSPHATMQSRPQWVSQILRAENRTVLWT